MRKILFFLVLIVVQLNSAFAFCIDPEPRIQTKLTRSSVAFIGVVVSQREVIEKDGGEDFITGRYWRFKVKEVFRGPKKKFIEIYEDNDSARMELIFNCTYLVFIEKPANGKFQGWCDDARKIEEKDIEKKISEIHEILKNIKTGANGSIRGFVEDGGAQGGGGGSWDGGGVAGIHFVIKGGGKTYEAVSDKNGWFVVSVPAGIYSVECKEPKMYVYPTDYSLDKPNHVEVKSGGGGELEFVINSVKRQYKGINDP